MVTLTPSAILVQEQFTREWEAVVDPPDAQNARVAGQYSWKSNLWQFGMVSPVLRAHLPCPSRSDDLVASTSINRRPCT